MKSEPQIIEHEGILVVRDDLIPGGTKARVLHVLLNDASEYVYASPVYGYAQIALAHVARESGKQATIFCAARKQLHARTVEAQRAGAKVIQVPHGYLTVVQARARAYCQITGAQLLPFGLDVPAFIEALADVARRLAIKPKEVWCAAGSGVLARALEMAWPQASINAVQVGIQPNAGQAKIYKAPEKFEDDAKGERPPFPSCSNYDAKAWRFIKQYAQPGALFWNVA